MFYGPNPGRFIYRVYSAYQFAKMKPYVAQRGGTLVLVSRSKREVD